MSIRHRYYLNALFDLELGGYPTGAVERSTAEMTVLFLPLMQAEDSIILDVEPPEYHSAYLRSCGFSTPDISALEPVPPDGTTIDTVWGWNAGALLRLGGQHTETIPPPLGIVREVNHRRFCYEVGRREAYGVPGSCFCDSADSFEASIEALRDHYPLVIKPAFGGAGFGLRVVRAADLMAQEHRLIGTYLQHGGFVVEPWCERVVDFSTTIDVRNDGSSGPVWFQRQWVNRYGTFYGMYCEKDDPLIVPWKAELEKTTLQLARAAAARGYFGPLGIDHFSYRDIHGVERLAAGIEVNARFTMGMLSLECRQRIASDKHTLLRFIGQKKFQLPDTIEAWHRRCGSGSTITFDAATGCGIVPLTPMRVRYKGKWSQPQRSVFFIAGTSIGQVESLDRELCSRFLPVACTE